MKNQLNVMRRVLLGSTVALFCGTASAEETSITGVLAPSPVQEHSCIAVEIPVGAGQPVYGLTWYHNDSGVTFPRLLLMEGEAGSPPDLGQTALVLADLSGSSLDWGSVTLDAPVTSSTGTIYAVFELPSWTERTATGLGGGPGLGYSKGAGTGNSWISLEGTTWIRVHEDYRVAVSVTTIAARSAMPARALADLTAAAPEGWWTNVTADARADVVEPTAEPEAEVPPRVTRDHPLLVTPNPFNPRTEISFYVERGGRVTVDIYDIRGRHINRVLSRTVSPGAYSVIWEGDDRSRRRVASGVYFIRVQTPAKMHQQRVALVR